jgi:hypothetical protein
MAVRACREYRQQEKQLNYHQLTHNPFPSSFH